VAIPIANPDWDPEIALDTDDGLGDMPEVTTSSFARQLSAPTRRTWRETPSTHSDLGAPWITAVNYGATEVSK